MCEAAARMNDLQDTEAEGDGVCLYDFGEDKLFMGNFETTGNDVLLAVFCQPLYASMGFEFQMWFPSNHAHQCATNHMRDISDAEQCTDAGIVLELTTKPWVDITTINYTTAEGEENSEENSNLNAIKPISVCQTSNAILCQLPYDEEKVPKGDNVTATSQ